MKILKNALWGVCAIVFLVCLVQFFKFGINYRKLESSSNKDVLRNDVTMAIDKIVREIKLTEVEEEDGLYMVGKFINSTNYNLPNVTIVYEIVNDKGEILREDKIKLGRIGKGETADIKISVGGMFNYSIRMTSSTNVGF